MLQQNLICSHPSPPPKKSINNNKITKKTLPALQEHEANNVKPKGEKQKEIKRIKTDYVQSNLKYRINSFHVYLELYESTRPYFCRFHSRNLVNETDFEFGARTKRPIDDLPTFKLFKLAFDHLSASYKNSLLVTFK